MLEGGLESSGVDSVLAGVAYRALGVAAAANPKAEIPRNSLRDVLFFMSRPPAINMDL
jgi:hypothetical protein